MQIDFHMPSLGADMESATFTQWLKKPGEAIHRGEALAVVETSKGLIDIESFDDGKMLELLVQPGANVAVGAVLARIDSDTAITAPPVVEVSPVTAPAPATPPKRLEPVTHPVTPAAPSQVPAVGTRRRPISPAARRRAHELGIALETLGQAESGGVIHIEDIEKLAAARSTQAAGDRRFAMRSAIGAAMARSKREIPHYYLGHAVDFGAAREWLLRYNAQVPVAERLIEGVLLLKAVALAAARIEGFNGYFREGRFEPATAVHVGTAIALRGGGLVAPALLDADRKDVTTLMREFSELVTRVRSGHMRSGEFTAATITVTSLGGDGADILYPIINPPQVAIVAAGIITERPWVCDGKLTVRAVLNLTVAADHRVTDGRAGSHFIHAVADLLATPEKL
jgi:pyruvate dehydrogenase E2 component (dihydrolipoamide acetyltransferase)